MAHSRASTRPTSQAAPKTIRRRRTPNKKAPETIGEIARVAETEFEADTAPEPKESPSGGKVDPYGRYLADMSRTGTPLLTPKEEIVLGRRLKAHIHKAVRNMIEDLETAARMIKSRKTDPLDRGRAMRCIARLNPEDLKGRALRSSLTARMCSTEADDFFEMYAEDEGKRLRDDFIKANLRLAISMARKYDTGGMAFGEIVQEGNIGLMHAVLRFDYRKGFRFSTYAGWWIRHNIGRALADKGRTIRIPVHMTEFAAMVHKVRTELTAKLGRKPTDEEVVKRLKSSKQYKGRVPKGEGESLLQKVQKLGTQLRLQFSLDQQVRSEEGDGDTLHEMLPDEEEEAPDWTSLKPGATLDKLRQAMGRLSPVQLDIIRLRFGIGHDEERTFKEIGEKYKLSRERIRQIQEQALACLRRDRELAQLRRELATD